jgi:hypothetical protein
VNNAIKDVKDSLVENLEVLGLDTASLVLNGGALTEFIPLPVAQAGNALITFAKLSIEGATNTEIVKQDMQIADAGNNIPLGGVEIQGTVTESDGTTGADEVRLDTPPTDPTQPPITTITGEDGEFVLPIPPGPHGNLPTSIDIRPSDPVTGTVMPVEGCNNQGVCRVVYPGKVTVPIEGCNSQGVCTVIYPGKIKVQPVDTIPPNQRCTDLDADEPDEDDPDCD